MDEHLPFDAKAFSGELPLFPLPNVVLLPGGLLSLHVFEPRYREMVRDVLAGERMIGMAILKPGYEKEYEKNPSVFPHACLGEITSERELPDGRWLITLRGMRRVLIQGEDHSRSYRVGSVTVIDDVRGTLPEELSRLRQLVAELAVRVPDTKMSNASELRRLLAAGEEVVGSGLYIDLVAAVTPIELHERLAILQAPTICERAHELVSGLVRLIMTREQREKGLILSALLED